MKDLFEILNEGYLINESNSVISQICMKDLPFFTEHASNFIIEFEKGGMLENYYFSNCRSVNEEFLKKYQNSLAFCVKLCVKECEDELIFKNAVESMLNVNEFYFKTIINNKSLSDDKSASFYDIFNMLISFGHNINDIKNYSYSMFVKFAKACIKQQDNQFKLDAVASRLAKADSKTFKEFIEK